MNWVTRAAEITSLQPSMPGASGVATHFSNSINTNTPMKFTLSSIVAFVAMILTAAAAPALRIDTTMTRADKVVSRPTLIVQSGELAFLTTGSKDSAFTYAVTPTLLDNGTVDLRTVFTEHSSKKRDKRTTARIVVPLGKSVMFRCGELRITAKPSLEKRPQCVAWCWN